MIPLISLALQVPPPRGDDVDTESGDPTTAEFAQLFEFVSGMFPDSIPSKGKNPCHSFLETTCRPLRLRLLQGSPFTIGFLVLGTNFPIMSDPWLERRRSLQLFSINVGPVTRSKGTMLSLVPLFLMTPLGACQHHGRPITPQSSCPLKNYVSLRPLWYAFKRLNLFRTGLCKP